MPSSLIEAFRQGYRTLPFPKGPVNLPERFRGRPTLEASRCPADCRGCVDACPTGAIASGPLGIDLGACIFCGRCQRACPSEAIAFTRDHRLAARERSDLRLGPGAETRMAGSLDTKLKRLFGRSLKLRQVSAGGCNSCEQELAVLGTVGFDLGRFGIQFVASPRHADGIVITGPVTQNMATALMDTYAAVPSPKIVIAVGACSISGGAMVGGNGYRGLPTDLKVDLWIPGCPPHPLTTLDGLLRLIGRMPG